MSQIHKHPIPANIAERCLINPDQYILGRAGQDP